MTEWCFEQPPALKGRKVTYALVDKKTGTVEDTIVVDTDSHPYPADFVLGLFSSKMEKNGELSLFVEVGK